MRITLPRALKKLFGRASMRSKRKTNPTQNSSVEKARLEAMHRLEIYPGGKPWRLD